MRVTGVAYYDDLDPNCLTGGITFGADGYTALARLCRTQGWEAIGDIHTHPGSGVRQSVTDATHPMVAIDGHVAIIVPGYAQNQPPPSTFGVHRLLADGTWNSAYDTDVPTVLSVLPTEITPPLTAAQHAKQLAQAALAVLTRLARRLRHRRIDEH